MTNPLLLLMDHLNTPIGEMLIVADEEGNLRAIDWSDYETRMYRSLRLYNAEHYTLEPTPNPHGLTHAIERYFAGELTALDTLPVKTEGTPFQQSVWNALRTIPCGSTLSYAALAAQIGRPAAVRAVGLANRFQSSRSRCALSSRNRSQRITHWLRRRHPAKILAAQTRIQRSDKRSTVRIFVLIQL